MYCDTFMVICYICLLSLSISTVLGVNMGDSSWGCILLPEESFK